MVDTPIPQWIIDLDDEKPYADVVDGIRVPPVSPYWGHGRLAIRIGAQFDEWAGDRGGVGTEVRFYFLQEDGNWTSLLPDVDYLSFARWPPGESDDRQRPRVAPDIAVEILSPSDRPGRTRRKVETYLRFGSTLVVVLHPKKRHVTLYRNDGSVEEREARGTWALEPFDGLVLDWERVYHNVHVGRGQ